MSTQEEPPAKRLKVETDKQEEIDGEENSFPVSDMRIDSGAIGDSFESEDDELDFDFLESNDEALGDLCKFKSISNSVSLAYKPMDQSELIALIDEKIAEVNEVLQEETEVARALMAYYKWDCLHLLQDFYTKGKEKCCKMAGIGLINDPGPENLDNVCCICIESGDGESIVRLDCLHAVCCSCLHSYIIQEVTERRMSCIQCPQCKVPMKDQKVVEILGARCSELKRNLVEHFVQTNPMIKWCPAPETWCSKAIVANSKNLYSASCTCTEVFCFKCDNFDHQPLSCAQIQIWLSKRKNDHDNVWLHQNSKPCPNCQARIEKNGGCNWMTCYKCRHGFCWLCLGAGCKHFECVRFRRGETPTLSSAGVNISDDLRSRAREIERYTFYLTRYHSQEDSLKLEDKVSKRMLENIDDIDKLSKLHGKKEFSFITEALTVLKKSRQTLMSTFAYAYYTKPSSQLTIFEDNQINLQAATESLSQLIESEQYGTCSMNQDKLDKFKVKVMDSTCNCKNRLEILIDHAKEGTLELVIGV